MSITPTQVPTAGGRHLEFYDFRPRTGDTRSEVLEGLSLPQKLLPTKLLYDQKGSFLFDQICELPEYYLTRTETAILREHAGDMAELIGVDCRLVEFGSGSSTKTPIMLDALEQLACYMPIDISRGHLLAASKSIMEDYPDLTVVPVVADYTHPLELPGDDDPATSTCAFFPGSTIGNFEQDQALTFLRRAAALVGDGGYLLLGIDLRKDPCIIEQAYNDAAGVTAEFNLNILNVVNRIFDGGFDPELFAHVAAYDEAAGRIEMRLCSLRQQEVSLGERRFRFAEGEYIITEYSHKFDVEEFAALAARAGFRMVQHWRDPQALFAVCCLCVEASCSS